MSKTMILAETGFGKTISACGCVEPELGINILGLDPKWTYFISATSKPLPRRGSAVLFPVTTLAALTDQVNPDTRGRRIITNDAYEAAKIIEALIPTPIRNIVVDDSNYFMQDYFMENALKVGWDAPKKIGHFMSKLFAAMEKADKAGKNVFMMAHFEDFKKSNNGDISFRMKTTGKSVQEYITPEGKFDVILFGKKELVSGDGGAKKLQRSFVTNDDGDFPGKSSPGMFREMYIPNDLGYAIKRIDAYYKGEEVIEEKQAMKATPPVKTEDVKFEGDITVATNGTTGSSTVVNTTTAPVEVGK